MAEKTTTAGIPAALVAILRHAKAEGWTFHRTTSFGVTDWSWKKDGRDVVAMPGMTGWSVHVRAKGDFYPDSVAELADVLVAVGYLPAEWATTFTMGRVAAATDVERMPINLGDEGWSAIADKAAEAGYDRRLVNDRRRRGDFTTDTIEVAYQYAYRRAAQVAKSGGAR